MSRILTKRMPLHLPKTKELSRHRLTWESPTLHLDQTEWDLSPSRQPTWIGSNDRQSVLEPINKSFLRTTPKALTSFTVNLSLNIKAPPCRLWWPMTWHNPMLIEINKESKGKLWETITFNSGTKETIKPSLSNSPNTNQSTDQIKLVRSKSTWRDQI